MKHTSFSRSAVRSLAALVSVGSFAAMVGCGGGLPGMTCKFKQGEVVAAASGDAKVFLDKAMQLKKLADADDALWTAEIKAMGAELKIENPNEENVFAKISANVQELKVKGQCEIAFEAKFEADAEAAGGAEAGSGGASAGGAAHAHAEAEIKIEAKCKAEASVKGNVDVTIPTIKAHFPKLIAVARRADKLAIKAKEVAEAGAKMAADIKDLSVANEVSCAGAALKEVQASFSVHASFSVKAEASARGEAKAG
jgi:hypothetical protein